MRNYIILSVSAVLHSCASLDCDVKMSRLIGDVASM